MKSDTRMTARLLSESGRLLALTPESGRSSTRLPPSDEDYSDDDFSNELAKLMDAEWGDEEGPATHRRITRRFAERPVGSPLRPEIMPLGDSWLEDLEEALHRIENAPVTEEERKRLSRDPGQAEVNAQLKQGPLPRNDRGTRRLRRGNFGGAITDYSQAIRDAPDHPQPWTKRGIAMARAGKIKAAVEDYTKALELNPEYLPALANRASAQYHLDDLEATCADCTATLELAPKLSKAWLFRGISRAKLGNTAGAQEDLYHFLRLSPYSPYVGFIWKTLKECTNWKESVKVDREAERKARAEANAKAEADRKAEAERQARADAEAQARAALAAAKAKVEVEVDVDDDDDFWTPEERALFGDAGPP